MARYSDGTTYNSGARYGVDSSIKHMNMIKINMNGLPVAERLSRGQNIITRETANANVPGNTAVLAAFSTAQTTFAAAEQAAIAAREASKQATAARDAADVVWRAKLLLLASFTESATGGDPVKILTTGFEVRSNATPRPVPGQVVGVIVKVSGGPGHSKVSWPSVDGADGYLVQGSPDPVTPTSWTQSVVSMKTTLPANGATAGQKYWYRIAAFNTTGQGEWSVPAERQVI